MKPYYENCPNYVIFNLISFLLQSQQSIKQRLAALEKENKKKRQVQDQEKKQKEKNVIQTQFEIQRARTRQEIYALNKIMTKLEKEHFKRFHEKMKNR